MGRMQTQEKRLETWVFSLSQRIIDTKRQLPPLPPVARRIISLLGKTVGLLVLGWMVVLTYQQRHVLFEALDVNPIYLIPIVICYGLGFVLAVVNWHTLLRLFGEKHSFFENYAIYAYTSACRYFPIPYFSLGAMLYKYQQAGTTYRTTGLAMLAFSIVYIVSGVMLFLTSSLVGVAVNFHASMVYVVVSGALLSLLLHPSVFTAIIRVKSLGEEDPVPVPPITWKTMLMLVAMNITILLLGGGVIFFFAKMVLGVSYTLLPVCIAAWSLLVSATLLISWLPSDFGITQIVLLAVFQSHLPVALVTAVFATWRLGAIVLDLLNAGSAMLIQHVRKDAIS